MIYVILLLSEADIIQQWQTFINVDTSILNKIFLTYVHFYIYFFDFKSSPKDVFIDFRERGKWWGEREKERERDTHTHIDQFPPIHALTEDGICKQPRYVPSPGIEPATFCWMGCCSNQLSHPARATFRFKWIASTKW